MTGLYEKIQKVKVIFYLNFKSDERLFRVDRDFELFLDSFFILLTLMQVLD